MKTAIVFLSSIALFSYLSAADSTTELKQENLNIERYENPKDVVVYTNHKDDKEFLDNLAKKYTGLSDEQKVNALLKEQNYIEVLNYVWTEPDGTKRITWLEKAVKQGHPILMFELGEEYYKQNPSIDTYLNKTMPWLLAGARRTLIDADCTSDESAAAAPEFLLETYQEGALSDLLTKQSQEQIEKYVNEHAKDFQKNSIVILKQVLQPLVAENQTDVPSPNWVFMHGLGGFTGDINNITDKECNAIRKKDAEEFLKQASQIEATLK